MFRRSGIAMLADQCRDQRDAIHTTTPSSGLNTASPTPSAFRSNVAMAASATTPIISRSIGRDWAVLCQACSLTQVPRTRRQSRSFDLAARGLENDPSARGRCRSEPRMTRRYACTSPAGSAEAYARAAGYSVMRSRMRSDNLSGDSSGIQWLTPGRTAKRYGASMKRPVASAPARPSAVSPSLHT